MDGEHRGRRRTARLAAAAAIALAALGAACGSGSTETGTGTSAGGSATNGQAVYVRACASCHGNDLRGTDKGPSHLSKFYAPGGMHGDEAFRRAIAQGSAQHHWCFGNMPPVPGLSEQDVTDVITYIRMQQRERGIDEGNARC